MRHDILIGIDPDTDKSGVAIKRNDKLEVQTLSFFALYDALEAIATHEVMSHGRTALVRISAGWLNRKTNFRQRILKKTPSGIVWVEAPPKVRERMSEKVGRNHQVGYLIMEMCARFGLTYEEVRPSQAKMTPEWFERITKIKTRSQEIIDAAVLVL
jgi:hypothetical protein